MAGGEDMLGKRPFPEKGAPAVGWLWGKDVGKGGMLKGDGKIETETNLKLYSFNVGCGQRCLFFFLFIYLLPFFLFKLTLLRCNLLKVKHTIFRCIV